MKSLGDASVVASQLISEIKNVQTQTEIKNELKSLLSTSMCPGLLIAVLVCFHWDTMVVSWLLVIYLSRKINKAELPDFQRYNPFFKSRLIWVKVFGMLTGMLASRIGIEIFVYVSLMIFPGKSSPEEKGQVTSQTSQFGVEDGVLLVFEGVVKFLQFVQYFSFYRFYLYVFMAFGSFIAPRIKDKFPLPEDEDDGGGGGDNKKTD